MVSKKTTKKKGLGKIKGFSIQFLPYSEIRDLDSDERLRKILGIVLGNNIIILQGKLKPHEESRLIGDTMAMIGHVKGFKGIELATISGNGNGGMLGKMRSGLVKALSRGEIGAITIIGPATVVKEMKRDPRKIELLLNR